MMKSELRWEGSLGGTYRTALKYANCIDLSSRLRQGLVEAKLGIHLLI